MATYSSNTTIAQTVTGFSGTYGVSTLYACPAGRYADLIIHRTDSANLVIHNVAFGTTFTIPLTAYNGSRATYSLVPGEELRVTSTMIVVGAVIEYRATP